MAQKGSFGKVEQAPNIFGHMRFLFGLLVNIRLIQKYTARISTKSAINISVNNKPSSVLMNGKFSKFIPKKPVIKLSGKKIAVNAVNVFITSLL
jgi:hypothetical protein